MNDDLQAINIFRLENEVNILKKKLTPPSFKATVHRSGKMATQCQSEVGLGGGGPELVLF